MKFKLPSLDPSLTFDDQDIFNRKDFAKSLTHVVTNTSEGLVISLEAQWGDGKTSFVYKWLNDLSDNHEVPCLYIDAYKNDFQNDPFSLLVAEIYTYASKKLGESDESINNFIKQVKPVSTAIAKGSLKTVLQVATAGLFSGQQFDSLEKNVASEMGKVTDGFIDNALQNHLTKQASMEELGATLTNLATTISEDKPLVVVIDELDRCKPSFALEMLETIKHLFTAERVIFVLVNNPHQLEESLRVTHGHGIDARSYLIKFYDVVFSFPKGELRDWMDDEVRNFAHQTLIHVFESNRQNFQSLADCIADIHKRLN